MVMITDDPPYTSKFLFLLTLINNFLLLQQKHTAKLREELSKLQPPEFLREQLDPEVEPLPPLSSDVANDVSCASVSEDADKSSENDAEHSGSSSSSQEITTAETSTADSQIAEPSNMFGMPPGGVVVYDPVWGFD